MEFLDSKQCMNIVVLLLHGEMKIKDIQKSFVNKFGTYPPHSGICERVDYLKELGLVNKRGEGRKRLISLTSKGELVARLLKQVKDEL